MHYHIATAVTVHPPRAPRPLRAISRAIAKPLSDGLTLADHFVAGAVASGLSVAAMHPMDTIKTLLQKAPAATTTTVTSGGAATAARRNVLSTLFATVRTNGPGSLYRGLAPSLISQVPAGAIKFAAFETLSQFVRSNLSLRRSEAVDSAVDYTCAALAFVACSVALVPGELMKQRLQAGVFKSMSSAVSSTFRTSGFRGMYVGYNATLLRDVPYTMLEFGLYSRFKRVLRLLLRRDQLSGKEELLMGGLAGGCTGFLTTPLDVAKTRLMTQSTSGQRQYAGIFDALAKVARTEGIPGLFKGSAARVVWLIPFTALYFGVHEASKRILLERKHGKVARKTD